MTVKKIFMIILVGLLCLLWYLLYNWAIDITIDTIDSYEPGPTILMVGGTHGNEPAGKDALNRLLQSNIKLKRGNLIIIPEANKSGGFLKSRWLLHNWIHPDLNRNYTDQGKEDISKKIIDHVHNSDLIVDFHEAWGYRNKNKDSMGSTLSYTTDQSKLLANEIIDRLNQTIDEDYKKFTVNEEIDELLTLRNYAGRYRKDYILMETTGQNNVQNIETRVNQNMMMINHILLKYGMIDPSDIKL
jgi:predicted deacylase